MQSDEVIWQIINHGHCSYKVATDTSNFCRNEHNLTGMCNRSSCPLANSQYATVVEEKGVLHLCTKTVERSHMPAKLWRRIELSSKYDEALEQIDQSLRYWPKFLVHKSKQRLTKLTQMLLRIRKLEKLGGQRLETMPTRQVQREARAEAKASKAARLDKSIESELLARLSTGVYESSYRFSTSAYAPFIDETRKAEAEKSLSRSTKRRRQSHKEIEYEQSGELDR